ncbi:MAG: DNA recombination protein RmuC [Alphaproteobacteria bacterium]|nr:DNA recombination protein RmuC [Alphaproteobacteria bacterium]
MEFLYAGAGLAGGIILAALFFWTRILGLERRNAELSAQVLAERAGLEQAAAALDMRFKATAQEALSKSSEQFLQLAREKLLQSQAEGAHDLEKRHKAIETLVEPVNKQLEGLGKALEQMKGTDQALREDLKNLNRETGRLAGALRNPAMRGNWGEGILERLLETSGLIKDIHYTLQKTFDGGRLRPDAVINLPESLHIVIDAKAPINDFVRSLDSGMDEDSYKTLQVGLAQAVRGHITDLGRKAYWEQLNSPDFVVLFLPSEHLFSAAVQADPSLLEYAADKKVVLASPVLTMSLLRVVGMSWRQVALAQNAQEISERGANLYKRLLAFAGHIEKIRKGLQSALGGYNDAVGSLERSVLPAARKFKDLQGQGGAPELPSLLPIEDVPRALALIHDQDESEEEDEGEKRRA